MMPHDTAATDIVFLMAIVKGCIAILGGVITYFSLKAYRHTRDRSLGYLSLGFAFVTLGAIMGGMVFEILNVDLATGVFFEGIFVLIGFIFIAYSLRVPIRD